MKVVRLEHDNGFGPYYSSTYDVAIQCHTDERSPSPDCDGITAHNMGYHFGFLSVEHMLEWFEADVLEQLVDHGIGIYEFEVDETWVQVGGKQLVFNKSRAEVVRTLELDEVLT